METIDKTYLEEIKEAAREGAKEGVKESKLRRGYSVGAGIFSTLLGKILFAAIVIAAVIFAISAINPFPKLKEQLQFENGASEHDLVLENQGLLGYTAADFAEAVLGDQSKLCKLEVLQQEISDVGTLTETGLGNLKIFSKTQLITYHGTAVYTVDLSQLDKNDFSLDDEKKEVTVSIPHSQMEPINIQSEDIEFGDVDKGLLAFGDIKATPEQMAEIQTEVQAMMEQKVLEDKVAEDADRFAKLAVWEMFQPVINSVTKGYSLVVEFQ